MTEMHRFDRIRTRALMLWESEGCPEGREAEFWDRAEAELSRAARRSNRRVFNDLADC